MADNNSFFIKVKEATTKFKNDEVVEILPKQIQVGRLPECYICYSEQHKKVSRLHAIITNNEKGVWLTKPMGLQNEIIVNGSKMTGNETKLENNSKVQFAIDGPQIIIPFKKSKTKKKASNSKIDWSRILLYTSYGLLVISIIILIVTLKMYL